MSEIRIPKKIVGMDLNTLWKFVCHLSIEPGPLPTPCWVWQGPTAGGTRDNGRYGRINGRYVHRVAYEHFKGEIPAGLEPDHLCRVRLCANPAHLEAVTRPENERRALALRTHCPKGHEYTPENTYRTPKGHRRCRECRKKPAPAEHLTDDQVLESAST